MHVLILSSRCTEEQRNGLTALRGYLETHGDLCEALDWYSFLSDSVSRINARSRKLVRHHIQELLAEGFSTLGKSDEKSPEKGGFHKLVDISAKELARFIQEGDYELVLCAEPIASALLERASKEAPFSAVTVLMATEDHLQHHIGLDHVLPPESVASDQALEETVPYWKTSLRKSVHLRSKTVLPRFRAVCGIRS